VTGLRNALLRGALGATLALTAGGCYKATFIRDPQAVKGETHDQWTSFFLWGLAGTERVDVHEFCPSGNVAQVRTGGNFGTGIVTAFTFGIYAPRKVYVTCAADQRTGAAAPRYEIDSDGGGRPTTVRRFRGDRVEVAAVEPAGEVEDGTWRVRFAPSEVTR
jgi:hypothetical protein